MKVLTGRLFDMTDMTATFRVHQRSKESQGMYMHPAAHMMTFRAQVGNSECWF